MNWGKFVDDILPIFGQWLNWIVNMEDEEWENISKAWPAPTRLSIAKLRYEAKTYETFFKEE